MKRLKRILLVFLATFSLCGCSKLPSCVNEISYDDYKNKIENKESFNIYFGRKSCYGCKEFEKTIDGMLKENKDPKTWFYIDITKVDYEGILKKEFLDLCHELIPFTAYLDQNYNYDSVYTPTLLKFINGELKYAKIGSISEDEIEYLSYSNYVYLAYYESIDCFNEEDSFLYVFDENDSNAVAKMKEIIQNDTFSSVKYFIKKSTFPSVELERLRLLIDNCNPGDSEPVIPETYPSLVCYNYRNGTLSSGHSHF